MEGRFGLMEGRFDSLEGRFDSMEGRFDSLEKSHKAMEKSHKAMESAQRTMSERLDSFERVQDKTLSKIAEMDSYLRDKTATKDELREAKSEIMNHIDGFAGNQRKFDAELAAANSRMDRFEGRP